MGTLSGKNPVLLILVIPLLMSLLLHNVIASDSILYEPLKMGPFVDKVLFKVVTSIDDHIEGLLNNEVDIIGDVVEPSSIDQLCASEEISMANVLRNGYGYITINCAKYPLNYTSFRRALAFALDKEAIADDVWDGYAHPQDSIVPVVNPWTVEGQLPYSYYAADTETGNQLLDETGFFDIDSDGFREAPDGSDFSITVEVAQSSEIAMEVGELVEEALDRLQIDGESVPTDFYSYLNRLYFHGDYDIVFLGSSFTTFDVDWLAYEFCSQYVDEIYFNFPNWQNAEYDSWREQLLNSTEYHEVYEAAIEMQKVFIRECPYIVCYESYQITAYRNDRFEGFVNDVSWGIPSWWTNYKTHLRFEEDGPFGGILRYSYPLDADVFNFMVSYSYGLPIAEWLYSTLILQDPHGHDIPWLAESYRLETHDDNPSIANGYTRLTFDILNNATWTDGEPIAPVDVAYSFNYYRDAPGNPYGVDLQDIIALYATANEVIIEFNTESYWHLHKVGYLPIIPKHVFQEIGPDGWNTWNPQPPTETMVTSGPFNVTDYVPGSHTELSYVPTFFYSPNRTEWTNPVTTDFGGNGTFPLDSVALASWLITGGSVIVIAGVIVLWTKERT